MKKKVFITRSILNDGQKLLEQNGYEVSVNTLDRPLSYEELIAMAKNYDALITMLSDTIDQEFLMSNKHLKIISNYAVGFNNIDIKVASGLGILIGNTPDVLTEATAEVALGLMISAARKFTSANRWAKDGKWKNWHPTEHLGFNLNGKKLGIVGFGRIGQRLADMAYSAFKMEIYYNSPNEKSNNCNATRLPLNELLSMCDVISLHAPLNSITRNFIGKPQLSLLKKTAILINTSRGELIDQKALVEVLKNQMIFAAGLDVTDPEPLPKESELFSLSNSFVLPHIGSASIEARKSMSIVAAQNIISAFKGENFIGRVNNKN